MERWTETIEGKRSFIDLLVRLIAIWAVYRLGVQLRVGVESLWIDEFLVVGMSSIFAYLLSCGAGWYLWANCSVVVDWIFTGQDDVGPVPDIVRSIDPRLVVRVVGLSFVAAYLPIAVQAAHNGFLMWETVDETSGAINVSAGFVAAQYWRLWLGSWLEICASVLIGGWLLAGSPEIVHPIGAAIKGLRTAGSYIDEGQE